MIHQSIKEYFTAMQGNFKHRRIIPRLSSSAWQKKTRQVTVLYKELRNFVISYSLNFYFDTRAMFI